MPRGRPIVGFGRISSSIDESEIGYASSFSSRWGRRGGRVYYGVWLQGALERTLLRRAQVVCVEGRIVRAVGFTSFGGPDVLRMLDLPDPKPGPGEVRVRVRAAAVNPSDTLRRNGARSAEMRTMAKPYVAGMEFAGVLKEVGRGTETDLQIGEDVMGVLMPTGSRGAYSEQVIVAAESVVRMPSGSDYLAASTLPMNGLTALITLDALSLSAGQTIAVTGAPGAYGGFVVQLAKIAGLTVIADAGPSDYELMERLGADQIVDRGRNVSDHIRRLIPGGAHGVADGALMNDQIANAVCDGGGIATLRGYEGKPERGIVWHPIHVRQHLTDQKRLLQLCDLAGQGRIHLRVADAIPADRAAEAHRRLEAGGVRGRIVLMF